MFNNKALLEQIDDLKRMNRDLESQVKSLEERKLAVVYDDIDSCAFGFDWAGMNAFSIERNHRTDLGSLIAYTIIGYLSPDDNTIGEWQFVCSQEEHNCLAQDFTLYLAMKNQPKPTKVPPTPKETKK